MENIKSIKFYDDRGQEDSEGTDLMIELKENKESTIEEENYIFDKLLTQMRKSETNIYSYIEYFYKDEWVSDDTSFELAKRLGRSQEIVDLVASWLKN